MSETFTRLPAGEANGRACRSLLDALHVQMGNADYWRGEARAWQRRYIRQLWLSAAALLALGVSLIAR